MPPGANAAWGLSAFFARQNVTKFRTCVLPEWTQFTSEATQFTKFRTRVISGRTAVIKTLCGALGILTELTGMKRPRRLGLPCIFLLRALRGNIPPAVFFVVKYLAPHKHHRIC